MAFLPIIFFCCLFATCGATSVKAQSLAPQQVQQDNRPLKLIQDWQSDHTRAVRLARQGNYPEALNLMRQVYVDHSDDVGVTRDYLTILSWAGGYDAYVINLYRALPRDEQPDYVLAAVATACRNLERYDDAVTIYQYGLSRSPNNAAFSQGLVRNLSDAGRKDEALAEVERVLQRRGNDVEMVLLAGDLALATKDYGKAQRYLETAKRLAPRNNGVLRLQILLQNKLEGPQAALAKIQNSPNVLTPAEYREIQGDEAAAYVRRGLSEPRVAQPNPYAYTDYGLALENKLIQEWSPQKRVTQREITRARFDRIVALNIRARMPEVIDEYNKLMDEGVKLPNYVLSSVGDAYLYLHKPEKARDLYLQVLETEPKNPDVRRQLFYAYTESGDYDKANALIDQLAEEQTQMYGPKSGSALSYKLAAGAARLYSGKVKEADKKITPVATEALDQPASREALGNLYAAKGLPRAAMAQYKAGSLLSQDQRPDNQIGQTSMHLALQEFPQAEATNAMLVQRYPELQSVRRTNREWQIHNMAELRLKAGYAFEPMTDQTAVSGGQGYGLEALFYSAPIKYNWRLFAGEYYAHQQNPNAEGAVGFSRTTAGVEYRKGPLVASVAPTYNLYNSTNRVGAAANAGWSFNDNWRAAASAEIFARGTPLRAMNSGVTANSFAASGNWYQDETRQLGFGGYLMPFSDDNLRTGVYADFTQNLYMGSKLRVDGLVSVASSQNSKDANRTYYNPSVDFIGLIGARGTHTLYQRYGTLYQHSLTIMPGDYWQQHFDNNAALRMRYEHRLHLNQVFETGLGVDFARQSYDGNPENNVSLTFDLTGRF